MRLGSGCMPDACNLQQPWASGRSAVIALLPNEYLIRPHGDSFAWCSNILIAPSVAIGLLAVPAPLCAHPEVAFACGRTCACACVACMCACACVRVCFSDETRKRVHSLIGEKFLCSCPLLLSRTSYLPALGQLCTSYFGQPWRTVYFVILRSAGSALQRRTASYDFHAFALVVRR